MTTEDTIVTEVRKAIEAIGSPTFRVRESLAENPLAARDGDVFLVVVRYGPPQAIGTSRREHLELMLVGRARVVAATSSTSAYAEIFAATRAVMDALRAWPALQAGGTAGVEQLRRGPVELWYAPGAETGQPAGWLLPVTVDWHQ